MHGFSFGIGIAIKTKPEPDMCVNLLSYSMAATPSHIRAYYHKSANMSSLNKNVDSHNKPCKAYAL